MNISLTMKRFKDFIIYWFILLSLFFCSIRYLNIDLIKRRFFLIFSLLTRIGLLSFSIHIWYSYFICLLFLRGIFVILVYFSSLSKINFVSRKGVIFRFLVSLLFLTLLLILWSENLSLNNFYYNVYWFQFIYIILVLLFFINFCSYFLNFSGALRKV